MSDYEKKVLSFAIGIQNAYKDEEEREEQPKLKLTNEGLTEDFTAMLSAMHVMYIQLTDDDVDLIGFTHLLNRLSMQHLMEPKKDTDFN